MRLAGKVALVTGAARRRGIGREIVTCLAEEGADVVINDVGAEDEALELVEQVGALGRRAIWHQADVSDRDAVDEMFRRTAGTLGVPDIVCSNAGVASWQPFLDITDDAWRQVVDVNVIGALNVSQAAARMLIAAGRPGRIVFTSSVHVQMPFAQMAVYGASKSAIRALADVAAIELAPHGITVNHVGPGWVKSHINDASPALQTEDDVRNTLALIPLGRPADPREIGRAVTFLVSEDGDYITGEFLRVDGGFVVGKH